MLFMFQAAAIPLAGLTAYRAVVVAGKVKKGNYEAWLKAGKADARVHQPAALSGSFVPKLKAGKG